MTEPSLNSAEPDRDCPLCPRLAAFRHEWRAAEPAWYNAPVPTFGALSARLLVVGLAPGLRGANRTGRPFTGDYAGQLLYSTLLSFGFARGTYEARPDDGLELVDCAITNAARCVPPENRPTPGEVATCRRFLAATVDAMPHLVAILALGSIAHDSVMAALNAPRSAFRFAHGAQHQPGPLVTVFDSYHCSRLNTNTGRLTEAMFRDVVGAIRHRMDAA
ncbi:MAG: uracil-DNA glycosylase [Bauldia sp.]|nr:uracil-DNA glycosylase [Bauldia sp.]